MSQNEEFRDRLDDLFSDLESQASIIPVKDKTVPGWTWECDPEGRIIKCSPEVETALGITPQKIIGEDLFSFRLEKESLTSLRDLFEQGDFPAEVILNYTAANNQRVTIRAHIFPTESIDDQNRGWRGFNNVIQIEPEKPSSTPVLREPIFKEPPAQKITKPLSKPSFGIAVEGKRVFTIDRPSTSIGVLSQSKQETQIEDGRHGKSATLAVPVEVQQKSLGLLEIIDDTSGRIWTQNEKRLVEQIADQLAMALENARLFEETQVSLARTEALYNVGQVAIGFENREQLFQAVVNTLANVIPADRVMMAVIDTENKTLTHLVKSHASPSEINDETYQHLMDGLVGWCIRERKPAISPKGFLDPRETQEARFVEEAGDGSTVVVPMIYRDRVYGTISINNTMDHPDFTQGDIDLLNTMATQVATALENAHLFQEEQRRRRIADALSETARVVSATLELEDVGARLLTQLAEVIEFDSVSLQIAEGDNRRLVSKISRENGSTIPVSQNSQPKISDDPLALEIKKTQAPIFIPDTRFDDRWQPSSGDEKVRSWIGVPLISAEETIGFLFLEHHEPGKYNQETADLLRAIASQVSIAIRNASLFQQIQHRSMHLQTAAEISRAATSFLEPNPLVQQTVNLIKDRFDLYYVGLFIVDETGEWAVLRAGTGEAGRIQLEREHKLEIKGDSMIGTCIRTTKPQTPGTISEDIPRFVNPLLPDTQTEIALPLISRGRVIGAVSIQSTVENAFSKEDVIILQTMVDQVANALQNANLFDQTQARAEELAVLNEMSQALSQNLNVDTILHNIYHYASRLVDTATFYIALYDDENDQISFPFSMEDNQEIIIPPRKLGKGLTEIVIRTRESVLVQRNIEGWLEDQGIEQSLSESMPQSWLGVPLTIGDQSLGIICVQNENQNHFSENHRKLLEAVANQSAIALQNATLFVQTQEALAETEALLKITNIASSSFNIRETLNDVLRSILEATDANAGLITVINSSTDTQDILAHILPEPLLQDFKQNGLEKSFSMWVYDQAAPLLIENLSQNSILDASHLVAMGFNSYQGVPLEAKGVVLGTLGTFSKRSLTSKENELPLLQAIGQQIGVAVENSSLFEQIQQQARELEILNEMSRVLSTLFQIDEIIQTIYDYTSRLMDTNNFYIALYNQREDEVSFPIVTEGGIKTSIPAMKKRKGLTQYVIDTKEPLLISDHIGQKIKELGLEKIVIGEPATSWLGVPLIIGDQVLGIISIQRLENSGLFNEHHLDLLTAIARQSAIAIQTCRLFQSTQQQTKDLAVLNNMTRELTNKLDRFEVLETVYKFTSLIMDTSNFFIATYDQEKDLVDIEYNVINNRKTGGITRPLGNGLSDHIIKTGEALLLEDDISDHIRRLDLDYLPIEDGEPPLSWIGVPMQSGDKVVGVIAVQSLTTPRLYNERHRDLLQSIAVQTAISLQNVQLFQQTQKRARHLETAAEIARETTATLSIDELLTKSVNAVRDRFGYYHTSIYLLDDSGENAVVRASTGEAGEEITRQRHHIVVGSDSIIGEVTAAGKPFVINDTKSNNLYRPHPLMPETQAELCLPLSIGERVVGALDVQSTDPFDFPAEDVAVLQTLADQISVGLENAKSYQIAQNAIEETRKRVQDLTTLSQASQSLASAPLEMEEVGAIIIEQMRDVISFDASISISIIDSNDPSYLKTIISYSLDPENGSVRDDTPERFSFKSTDYPVVANVIETQEPLLIQLKDERVDTAELAYLTQHNVGTLFIFPLVMKQQSVGIIKIETMSEDQTFTPESINLLTTLANQAAISLENARLYEDQLETAEQLRELDELKSQFLANMSHELRTPLNSIIGFSRVIMKGIDGPVTDLQQQDLSAIYNAGQHLLKMINDILDISKIDAGRMELAFDEVNISDIINSVMSTARGLVKDKPIELITVIDDELPIINADATRIRQVLLNLISNAAKFTDRGTITVAAQKHINSEGHQEIMISVQDTGIGIPEEEQAKLFEPFVQVDGSPTRATGGTGLGLSITRMLVELHNGRIGLESEPGKGSNFVVTLPVDETGQTSKKEVDGTPIILAIDDDLQVIQLYERYLDDTRFDMIPLDNPELAIVYSKEIKPFAITLDVLLPDHNGWNLLKELKTDPETRDIPVIICSIIDEPHKGKELGADGYLVKPILANDFVSAIYNLWEKHQNQ